MTCPAFHGKDSNSRGKLPLRRNYLAFCSRKPSIASQRRTISPHQTAASSAWVCTSSRPMKTPWWGPPDVPIKEHQRCLCLHQWPGQACPAQLRLTSSQPGTHALSFSLLFPILLTLLQMLQISSTNEQGCSGSGLHALLLLRLVCMIFGH